MISRFLPKEGTIDQSILSKYADHSQIATWASDGMAVMINKGYIQGYEDSSLDPLGVLTRAEAVTIIGKLLKQETIVSVDFTISTPGQVIQDAIYTGDIIVEDSVGEGDATLKNISALSTVYVFGGGANTIDVQGSLVISMVVAGVNRITRVKSETDSHIYSVLVFNGCQLVGSDGSRAESGKDGYESVIYVVGTVTREASVLIHSYLFSQIDDSAVVTMSMVGKAIESILPNRTVSFGQDGNLILSPVAQKQHSNPVVTVPSVPATPVIASAHSGNGTVVISITGSAMSGGAEVMFYRIHVYDQNQLTQTALETTGSGTTATVGGLTNGETYTFRVSAVGAQGESGLSSQSSTIVPATVPDVPTGISIDTDDSIAILDFSSPIDNGGASIAWYTIYPYVNGVTQSALITTGSGTTITISGLTNGTAYTFSVSATNQVGEGTKGNVTNAVTPNLLINGIVATRSAITGGCGTNHLASEGAFLETVAFVEEGTIVTAYAIKTPQQLQHLALHTTAKAILLSDLNFTPYGGGILSAAGLLTPLGSLSAAGISTGKTATIRLNNFTAGNFVPIGGYSSSDVLNTSTQNAYSGKLYGNQKTIRGLIISGAGISQVGMFGKLYNGAVVQDLILEDGTIGGKAMVGSIAGAVESNSIIKNVVNSISVSATNGYAGGIAGWVNSSCTLSAVVNKGPVTAGQTGINDSTYNGPGTTNSYTGGIAGKLSGSVITDSTNAGAVRAYDLTGGLTGLMVSSSIVKSSANYGTVYGGSYIGGIAGYNKANLSYCFNTAIVLGSGNGVGGISGKNDAVTVNNTANSGPVSGASYVGGITGLSTSSSTVRDSINSAAVVGSGDIVGGVVGWNHSTSNILTSYNTGLVKGGTSYVGGITGQNTVGSTANGSWLEGTNLTAALKGTGVSWGTDQTSTFSGVSSIMESSWTSMSSILTSAVGSSAGAITNLALATFQIPRAFNVLQGSYLTTIAGLTLTVSALSNATIVVTTAGSLSALLTTGALAVNGTQTGNTFTYTPVSASGTWFRIKAESADPLSNRNYILYVK